MKIYNKNNFVWGAAMLLLGGANLALSLSAGAGISVITILLLITGAACIWRSLSEKLSKKDKLSELDERNRHVAIKARSRAFKIVQYGCLALAAAFSAAGAAAGPERAEMFSYIGVGFAAALLLTFFADFVAFIYYDIRS